MSTKAGIKLIYIVGMGLIGESAGRVLAGLTGKTEVKKSLMKVAGAATGAYAGIIIANELEDIITGVADDIKHKDNDHLEVNNG